MEEEKAVTAVISHEVRPEREEAFLRWQDKILTAQAKYPGFMGCELFRPVKGIQNNWVTAFRFDTREHLEDWLRSGTREKLLEEGRKYFVSYEVRKVGSAFSGWFRFEKGSRAGIPPNWKQAMSVVLALYPTVMILNLTVGFELDELGVPGYIGLFIGNILSVSILTWFLMRLVNRTLAFWLVPSRARSARTNVAGTAVVVVCYLISVVVFGLITGQR